jgi:S-adenosylmethionine decarboxylase
MDTRVPPTLYAVDLAECGELATLKHEDVTATFGAALRRAGATIVDEVSHAFPGAGLTCVFILSESHAVLHTWPETGTVNIEIFSCSTRLKSLEAINELSRSFGAQHVTVQEISRADGHGPRSDGRR